MTVAAQGISATPATGATRLYRAATATAVTLTVGAAGHLMGHGTISVLGVVGAAVALSVAAWLFTARECGWATIAAGTFVGQLVVHWELSSVGADSSGMSGMDHSLAMFAGHALAAVVVAWWLRRGERRIWQALRRAAISVRRLILLVGNRCRVPRRPVVCWSRRPDASGVARRLEPLRHVIQLRAPPLLESIAHS